MIAIRIDDSAILFKSNIEITILEACKLAGINIPRFCYHDLLSVSGNCRMCLVEIEEADKPIVTACTTEIEDEICILTDSALVQKARENILELLLLNHPLDCPICDQAGECDLQDQAKKYGGNFSRYFFKKKPVEDKYCGPLIKTIMTRCISCTRCVRFNTEIAGSEFYGTLSRGESTEIGSYVTSFFDSEISANVIDLCPVGALTSSIYAAKARPWELRVTESIDVTDNIHTNIYVSHKGTYVMRIAPKRNDSICNGLISDKGRYIYDANSENRSISLSGESRINPSKRVFIGWKKFLKRVNSIIESKQINFYINDQLDLESLVILKKLNFLYPNRFKIINVQNTKIINHHLCNNLHLFKKIDNYDTSSFLFLGSNPKIESPIFNSKLKIKANTSDIDIFSMGLAFNYNSINQYINLNTHNIFIALQGKINSFSNSFGQTKGNLIVTGNAMVNRINCINSLKQLFTNKITANPTFIEPSRYTNSEAYKFLNFNKYNSNLKAKEKKPNTINFFLKNEENLTLIKNLKNSKIEHKNFWYNTHKSKIGSSMNFSFPATSQFEEEKTFLNMEHRPQKTRKIVNISSGCKEFSYLIDLCFNLGINSNDNYICHINELASNKNKYNKLFSLINRKMQNRIFSFKLSQYNKLLIMRLPLTQSPKTSFYSNTFTKNSPTMKKIYSHKVTQNINF